MKLLNSLIYIICLFPIINSNAEELLLEVEENVIESLDSNSQKKVSIFKNKSFAESYKIIKINESVNYINDSFEIEINDVKNTFKVLKSTFKYHKNKDFYNLKCLTDKYFGSFTIKDGIIDSINIRSTEEKFSVIKLSSNYYLCFYKKLL